MLLPDRLQADPVFLLALCARGYLKAAVSQPVLLEAQNNIQDKLGEKALERFQNLLAIVPFSIAALPNSPKVRRLERIINKKDVHVVGAALEIRASCLLALDKGLVSEVNKAGLGLQAFFPGDFRKTILPNHVDYRSVRK